MAKKKTTEEDLSNDDKQVVKDEADAQEAFDKAEAEKADDADKLTDAEERRVSAAIAASGEADDHQGGESPKVLKARVATVAAKFEDLVNTDQHITADKVRALLVELKHSIEPQ